MSDRTKARVSFILHGDQVDKLKALAARRHWRSWQEFTRHILDLHLDAVENNVEQAADRGV